MPKTELGELLIARGLLTEEHLERALDRQRSFGARLGTCLLEIGALGESDLLAALSDQLSTPAASAADLRDLAPELIELLPRSTAMSCHAVPFRRVGDRVDVALLDPGNFAIEDELAFSINKPIKAHIANELRIVEALNRYYGGDVALRFRSLLEIQEARARRSQGSEAEEPALSPVPAYLRPGASDNGVASRKPVFAPPKFDKQAIPLSPDERAALEDSQDSIVESAAGKAGSVDPGTDRSHEVYGQKLSKAETASQIGAALIALLAGHFPRVLLFRVSSGHEEVTGWMSHGRDLDLEWFRHYSVGLHHATVFRSLADGAPHFTGRLPATPAHRALARCWDGTLERECLVLPVAIRGKLVCAAYADRGEAGLQGIDLQFLEKVAKKTALAFERCILRRKLQAT